MSLLAIGINHRTAPIAIREKAAFAPEAVPFALRDLTTLQAVNEAMILSTCNRTELYSDSRDVDSLLQWLAQQHGIAVSELQPCVYQYHGNAAVQHIMRVASGLDSMVLGEPEILGQVKQAYGIAKDSGTLGKKLDCLLQKVFSVSKKVRTDTSIGANPVTIAYATLSLAKRIYENLSDCRVLFVGAGETVNLVATHFANQDVKQIVVASRQLLRAKNITDQVSGHPIVLSDVPMYLKEVDIVVTATASTLPILGKGMMETAIKARKRRPIFMADLAVPRDIEPEVAGLEDVYLYNLDDLQTLIAENQANRQQAAEQAEAIIKMQAQVFAQQYRLQNAADIIAKYRANLIGIRDEELQKALGRLDSGVPTIEVFNEFARALTNKFMHQPTIELRRLLKSL